MIYEHYIRYKYNYIILAILSQLVKVTSKYSSGWRSYGNLNNARFANENFKFSKLEIRILINL